MKIVDKFSQFVLRSRLRGMLVAVLLVLIPGVRWLGWSVVGLVTLRKGAAEGGILIAIIAAFLVALGVMVLRAPLETLPAGASVSSALFVLSEILLSGLLIWGIAFVLRRYASWNKVFQICLWVSVITIALIHVIFPEVSTWWEPVINTMMQQVQKTLTDASLQQDKIALLGQQLVKMMTGIQIATLLIFSFFSLLIARGLQASLYNPGGLKQELLQIRLPVVDTGILIVVALFASTDVSATGKAIALDALPVVALIFVLAGISLVHRLVGSMKKAWIGIIVFYVVLIWQLPYMIFLLIVLALADSWINISHRLIKR